MRDHRLLSVEDVMKVFYSVNQPYSGVQDYEFEEALEKLVSERAEEQAKTMAKDLSDYHGIEVIGCGLCGRLTCRGSCFK